jgi:hypothetical protein
VIITPRPNDLDDAEASVAAAEHHRVLITFIDGMMVGGMLSYFDTFGIYKRWRCGGTNGWLVFRAKYVEKIEVLP